MSIRVEKVISIHAPREAERLELFKPVTRKKSFQSTLRARRSDVILVRAKNHGIISIHAPREAERRNTDEKRKTIDLFQSTLRARRSDNIMCVRCWYNNGISIHAPREAERRLFLYFQVSFVGFQSTLRARRSDCKFHLKLRLKSESFVKYAQNH